MTHRSLASISPHDYDHSHSDVGGGKLRAAVFGGMDGLVSNIGLIAGIGAAGASSGIVLVTGIAGLISGAFSMALGEFTSVRSQNEQLESEVRTERAAQRRNPVGERHELVTAFESMGMSPTTARAAAEEVHRDDEQAIRVHITQELGIDPTAKPSPWWAAGASFTFFAVGAMVPLVPYLLGFGSLWLGLGAGAVGLAVAGIVSARFTRGSWWRLGLRQLLLGGGAVSVTYLIGLALGVGGVA